MTVKVSDYIVSPLAMGTDANYECVKSGKTMLRRYEHGWGLPEPFVASMMDGRVLAGACRAEGISGSHTRFERMAILAAARALRGTGIAPDGKRVLFIIATTKGNIELLDGRQGEAYPPSCLLLTEAARRITSWFHNPNDPLVVCNACVSGLTAQIEAMRALESGECDYVVVIGADVLSPFVVSGFQSLKAVSDEPCRPFDDERLGLNLGEAAACIVYAGEGASGQNRWYAEAGAVRSDASHISTPSKTAEGACRALKAVLDPRDVSEIAFVNVHGTATMYNDEMEAVALGRMGLGALPAFGLKGYYGHTMGASGVLETLIAMKALDDHVVPATKGFANLGVSRRVGVSATQRAVSGTAFLKMMSGFGGTNAALLFRKGSKAAGAGGAAARAERADVAHTVRLTESTVLVDGRTVGAEGRGMSMLRSLYHRYVGDYPRFYKMDPLCKLGFVASELLLGAEAEADGVPRFGEREDRAVVLVGRSASLCADEAYMETIRRRDEYYPSPSAFVYTLPNIVAGEIAIRNKYHGETSYFVQDSPDAALHLMRRALGGTGTGSVVGGWIDVENENRFEATLYIIK